MKLYKISIVIEYRGGVEAVDYFVAAENMTAAMDAALASVGEDVVRTVTSIAYVPGMMLVAP